MTKWDSREKKKGCQLEKGQDRGIWGERKCVPGSALQCYGVCSFLPSALHPRPVSKVYHYCTAILKKLTAFYYFLSDCRSRTDTIPCFLAWKQQSHLLQIPAKQCKFPCGHPVLHESVL